MMREKKNRSASCQWVIRPAWPGRKTLAQEGRFPELIGQLLYNRGIENAEAARKYLQPSLSDLVEPQKLQGIAPAVRRIREAMGRREKIVIYGDYDVDGITAAAILWDCFRLAGYDADFYVPHRLDEGYGLNEEAIRQLAEKGYKLMITVDCGINAFAEALLAAQLGMDLIITDHHKVETELPHAVAIVHPDLPGQDYPHKNLCGAAVAFKLAWAMAQEFSGAEKVKPEFREFLLSATAFVSLGTIADIVPLQGENRILAVYGMQGLAGSQNTGIQALLEAAGMGSRVQSSDIAFRLAPRLNAAGRMGHARLAVELFTRCSPARAKQIAEYLEGLNEQRRKVEKEITDLALQQVVERGMNHPDWRGIVVAGENWHGGVIGIVASRVIAQYHRPTLVISIDKDKAMGSGRSIEGFDLVVALEHCKEDLNTFGGHAMAAGLKLDSAKVESLRRRFNEYACQTLTTEDLTTHLHIDAEVMLEELPAPTVEMIGRLGPFGMSNPPVKLVARNLKLAGPVQTMGKGGAHLQMTVAQGDVAQANQRPGGLMRAVAFQKARWEKKLKDAASFDLAFVPVINRYNGNTTVELMAEDIIFH